VYVIGNNHTVCGQGSRAIKGNSNAVAAFKKKVLIAVLSDCVAHASMLGNVTGIVVMGDWNLASVDVLEAVMMWPTTRFRRVAPTCHKLRL
jgi:hypothetical protein